MYSLRTSFSLKSPETSIVRQFRQTYCIHMYARVYSRLRSGESILSLSRSSHKLKFSLPFYVFFLSRARTEIAQHAFVDRERELRDSHFTLAQLRAEWSLLSGALCVLSRAKNAKFEQTWRECGGSRGCRRNFNCRSGGMRVHYCLLVVCAAPSPRVGKKMP